MDDRQERNRTRPEPADSTREPLHGPDWERLVSVGDVHSSADNVVSALEYYERALALAQAGACPEAGLIALEIKIVDCLSRRGQHGEVRERLAKVHRRSLPVNDPVLTARIVARLGRVENTLANYEIARENCLDAYRVLRSTDAHEEIGTLELTLGAIAHRLGDATLAREHYENALATFRRIDDSEGIARTLNNLGVLLISGPRWPEARDYFMRAIAVAEEAGNYARLASLCLNLGILAYMCGQWDLSHKHLTRALVISKETNPNLSVVRAHIALGILKLRLRQFTVAESHFSQILETARLGGFRREEALALEFLGDKYLREGNLEGAERRLREALQVCQSSLPDGDVAFEVQTRLAELALLRGRLDEAKTLAQSVLERIEDDVESGRSLRILGEVAAARGRFAEAEQYFMRATETLSATPDVLELLYSRRAEARFLSLRGRSGGTLDRDSYRASIAILEELVARFQDLQLPELSVETLLEIARTHTEYTEVDDALAAIGRGLVLAEKEAIPHVSADLEALRSKIEEHCADESLTRSAEFQLLQEVAGFGLGDPTLMTQAYLQLACARSLSDRAALVLRTSNRDLHTEGSVGMEARVVARSLLNMLYSEFDAGRKLVVVNDPKLDSRWAAFGEGVVDITAAVAIPIHLSGGSHGLLYLDRTTAASGGYRSSDLRLLSFFAGILGVFLSAREGERRSRGKAQDKAPTDDVYSKFITCNDELRRSISLLRRLEQSDAGVLITGETGTGKGLLARLVHEASRRAGGSFVPINCAALPESLLESELFGHVQGAFTGAVREKRGLFEEAEGGTLFLDEVDKAPTGVQAKLLHVLDKHEIRPVGSTRWKPVDVRVICATNVNLRAAIESGAFLEDLYYRLNDFTVQIPPLRQRREDIPLLVRYFYQHFTKELGRKDVRLSREVLQAMTDHEWRGNVRELEKVVKRMLVLAEDDETLGLDALPRELLMPQNGVPRGRGTLRSEVQRLEAQVIGDALRQAEGNKSEAARQLRVSYPCLLAKIKQYGLEPRRARRAKRRAPRLVEHD